MTEIEAPGPAIDRSRPGALLVLRLYVTGGAPRSAWAIRNVRALCDRYLAGRCDLAIIDLYQQPLRASEAQLVAAPTLVKESPLPLRRFIGILSDHRRILSGLGLDADAVMEDGDA